MARERARSRELARALERFRRSRVLLALRALAPAGSSSVATATGETEPGARGLLRSLEREGLAVVRDFYWFAT